MYCPSCANPVKDGLKYCNSCGANLGHEAERDNSAAEMLNGILRTVFWTAAVGLGILVGLITIMVYRQAPPEVVGMVTMFYLATLGMITFMLLRQVPKLIDAKLKSLSQPAQASAVEPAQMHSPSTAQLEEFRQPAMSVTDHTTKTLNKVPR